MTVAAPRAPAHVLQTAVVLDDARLLYVPVPKAACTAVLRALARAVDIPEERLARARKLEVTRDLAIHDPAVWGTSFALEGRSPEEVERILHAPDWLRFTVVREPLRRLWSAWVSKILAREPRFVAFFGHMDWFPAVPDSSDDVLESFRRFVRGLPARDPDEHDPHWVSQADLLGWEEVEYGYVGRAEDLTAAMDLLRGRLVAHGLVLPPLETANRSLLPYVPGVFDRQALEAGERWTARDRDAFGYASPRHDLEEPDNAWHMAVHAAIPALRAVIERHERIADLRRMAVEAHL